MLERAAQLLDCKTSVLAPFEVPDTFNGNQVLEGYLCHQSDHRYGAMVLFKVAGADLPEPQVIYGTPKLHYPFGSTDLGTRSYHFPPAQDVIAFLKLDGSNVFAYNYANSQGNRFTSFKTRLTPVLTESRFGPFRSMWQELLDTNESLRALVALVDENLGLSFEMYGQRNTHLIRYPESLATKLLFGVNQKTASVIPNDQFDKTNPVVLQPAARLTSGADLIAFYNKLRTEAEATNKKVTEGDQTFIDGTEGYVLYLRDAEQKWHLYKAKPEGVECIHWASDTIPLSRILPTVWNLLESSPEPTVEGTVKLLLEEFNQSQVDASLGTIEKAVGIVTSKIRWHDKVRTAYEATGLDITVVGKVPVLRALSGAFQKQEMKLVFTALRELGLIKE